MNRLLFTSLTLLFGVVSSIGQNRTVSDDTLMMLLRENRSVFLGIITAQNSDSLSAFYDTIRHPDKATELLFAIKLIKLRGNKSDEERLLRAIPQSKVELLYVCNLDAALFNSHLDDSLNFLFQSAWELWPHAVVHHHKYMKNYLMLGDLTEGYFAEDYSLGCAWLAEQDCVRFFNVLGTCHPDIQASIIDLLRHRTMNNNCFQKNSRLIDPRMLKLLDVK